MAISESSSSRRYTLLAAALFVGCFAANSFAQGQAQPAANASAPAPKKPVHTGFSQPDPIDFNDHEGYVSIFDGTSLKDWDGDPAVWHVENGAIVGVSTKEKPVENSYIVFRGLKAKDFDLPDGIAMEPGYQDSAESELDDDRAAGRLLVSCGAVGGRLDGAVLQ